MSTGTSIAVEPSEEKSVPNIVLILADDMGYSDAGCYGGEIQTPNLDSLAEGGLRFTQFYSTGRCWPSRACILTGYYAQQVRMDPPHGKLPTWARVMPDYLRPAGYRCYHSGKWHLRIANNPVTQGHFDRSYKVDDQCRFFSPQRTALDGVALPKVKEDSGYYATTAIADHAIEFLSEHEREYGEKPFCLYLAFTAPHFPLHALQKDIDRYRDAYLEGWDVLRARRYKRMREMGLVGCALSSPESTVKPSWNWSEERLHEAIGPGEVGYAIPWEKLTAEQRRFQATKMAIHAAMIDRMDREIGRVLGQVKRMGQFDDTLIIFVSDNGASAEQIIRADMHDKSAEAGSAKSYLCLGPGWSTVSNTPFRRHKSWNHEGGISSPMIVHWPNGIEARGALRHRPGHFIDLMPTLVELAGAKEVTTWNGKDIPPLPGKSLVPVLAEDGPAVHDYLYFHHGGNRAIRIGDWKLVSAGKGGPWELYDLSKDRSELNNLAGKFPEKTEKLANRWQEREDEFRRMAEE